MAISAGGVMAAQRNNHSERGGSIPASALHFQCGRMDDIAELIKRFHYSRRLPSNIQFIGTMHEPGGLFGDSGRALCGLCFSIPPTRWSEPVLELSRLVRREDAPGIPLTLLIRLSVSQVRRLGHDLLVSFADRTNGHHGGVYQAAGWFYGGCRDRRMDGLLIDGVFCPGRSCNSNYGTRSPDKLRALLPQYNIQPHYDLGKHLYWKALNKRGQAKAATLGLRALPYPKGM